MIRFAQTPAGPATVVGADQVDDGRNIKAAAMRRTCATVTLLAMAVLAGCSPNHDAFAKANVVRPLTGPADVIPAFTLTSHRATFAQSDGEPLRILLAFPLPGAANSRLVKTDLGHGRTGYIERWKYYLYLRLPSEGPTYLFAADSAERGTFLTADLKPGQAAQVQKVVAGLVKVSFNRDRTRLKGTFKIGCADNYMLDGEFSAVSNPAWIDAFEQEFARQLNP